VEHQQQQRVGASPRCPSTDNQSRTILRSPASLN
jgi:hypothetical protein